MAATDTSGNLTTNIVRYLPDDVYVDDDDPGYGEPRGTWTTTSVAAWGRTARVASVPSGDSATAAWTWTVSAAGRYQVRVLTPGIVVPGGHVVVTVTDGGQVIGSREYPGGIEAGQWEFVTAFDVASNAILTISLTVHASATAAAQASADVVQVSASTRDKWLVVPEVMELGEVIAGTPTTFRLTVRNEGLLPVTITGIDTRRGLTAVQTTLPVAVPPMGEMSLALVVTIGTAGTVLDTLILRSDDPRHVTVVAVLQGRAVEYFAIVDNGDPSGYSETGSWSYSVAQAFGSTSRFAYPAPGVSASFEAVLTKGGRYRILAIVPRTVNASDRARYCLLLDNMPVDSAFVNQNAGSGSWVPILDHVIPGGAHARVIVTDAMNPVISGRVLRADALRFQWVDDASTVVALEGADVSGRTLLGANYPNPFNPETTIPFRLPEGGWVSVKVYDLLGRQVASLVEGILPAGEHTTAWNASRMPSGVYLCHLAFGRRLEIRKLQLLR